MSPSAFSRRAVVSYWRKYVHKVLVNRLGGLSLPRKSVVRLTDRPDMTLDVYRGRKTTIQHTCIYSGVFKVPLLIEAIILGYKDWADYPQIAQAVKPIFTGTHIRTLIKVI